MTARKENVLVPGQVERCPKCRKLSFDCQCEGDQ